MPSHSTSPAYYNYSSGFLFTIRHYPTSNFPLLMLMHLATIAGSGKEPSVCVWKKKNLSIIIIIIISHSMVTAAAAGMRFLRYDPIIMRFSYALRHFQVFLSSLPPSGPDPLKIIMRVFVSEPSVWLDYQNEIYKSINSTTISGGRAAATDFYNKKTDDWSNVDRPAPGVLSGSLLLAQVIRVRPPYVSCLADYPAGRWPNVVQFLISSSSSWTTTIITINET